MRRRSLLGRLAFIPLGILLGLVVLEASLQAAAWFIKVTGREAPSSWLTDHLRIICLGDSNTYGLWLERSEAYPQQFEALWNETVAWPKVEVLNLGFPGTNSSKVLRDLPRMLETFEPEIVIVRIGLNDVWTSPFEFEPQPETRRSTRGILERHSRIYRLLDMTRRGVDSLSAEVGAESSKDSGSGTLRYGSQEFEMGWTATYIGAHRWVPDLHKNLQSIARQVNDYGADLVLMTYSSHSKPYRPANYVIRAAAEAPGTKLVDVDAAMRPHCPQEPCPEFIFEDHHPTARGYRVAAETIVAQLKDRLSATPGP